jgi:hypothetical protein
VSEQWKPVPGFEGAYEASSEGRVRSITRTVSDGSTRAGQVLRPCDNGAGYGIVTLCAGGVETTRTVHSLVAEAWLGPRPAGHEVCHQDGDSSHNAASNLRWGSHASNMRDQVRHGTNARTQRTHCPEGHALRAPNLRASELRLGRRSCRACQLGRRRSSKCGRTFARGDADDIYARLMASPERRDGPP